MSFHVYRVFPIWNIVRMYFFLSRVILCYFLSTLAGTKHDGRGFIVVLPQCDNRL